MQNEECKEIPDVLGFELEEALLVLSSRGLQVQDIMTTKPDKKVEKSGKARIVRLDMLDMLKVRVVVANYNL